MCISLPPQAEKAVLDVGEALVGSYRSIQVPLVNNSPCTVSFCLSVQQTLLDEEPSYDPETEPNGILFRDGFAVLPLMYLHDIDQLSACVMVSREN